MWNEKDDDECDIQVKSWLMKMTRRYPENHNRKTLVQSQSPVPRQDHYIFGTFPISANPIFQSPKLEIVCCQLLAFSLPQYPVTRFSYRLLPFYFYYHKLNSLCHSHNLFLLGPVKSFKSWSHFLPINQ